MSRYSHVVTQERSIKMREKKKEVKMQQQRKQERGCKSYMERVEQKIIVQFKEGGLKMWCQHAEKQEGTKKKKHRRYSGAQERLYAVMEGSLTVTDRYRDSVMPSPSVGL